MFFKAVWFLRREMVMAFFTPLLVVLCVSHGVR